ncbi:hypothetical protein P7C73_g5923, partial [Tremellales sp. Uapishka_1]
MATWSFPTPPPVERGREKERSTSSSLRDRLRSLSALDTENLPPPPQFTPKRKGDTHRKTLSSPLLYVPAPAPRRTTSKLREPTPLSMPYDHSTSTRTFELASSPGSMISDTPSSPTTSVESLPLPAAKEAWWGKSTAAVGSTKGYFDQSHAALEEESEEEDYLNFDDS